MIHRSKQKKYILTGYRAKGVELYTTDIKPLGRIVAGLGFMLIGYGALTIYLPSGSIFVISCGSFLLGLVGIDIYKYKKRFAGSVRFKIWKLRNYE